MREHALQQTSRHNKRGFTLVEVMVAIVITMVALLGLVEAVGIATMHNLKNQLRDEAVLIGEERMADLQKRPFGQMSTSFAPRTVPSRVRGTERGFTVNRREALRSSVNLPDGLTNTYELSVRMAWTYKNISSNYEVRALKTYSGI